MPEAKGCALLNYFIPDSQSSVWYGPVVFMLLSLKNNAKIMWPCQTLQIFFNPFLHSPGKKMCISPCGILDKFYISAFLLRSVIAQKYPVNLIKAKTYPDWEKTNIETSLVIRENN